MGDLSIMSIQETIHKTTKHMHTNQKPQRQFLRATINFFFGSSKKKHVRPGQSMKQTSQKGGWEKERKEGKGSTKILRKQ